MDMPTHQYEQLVDVPDVAYLTNTRKQEYPIGARLKEESQLIVDDNVRLI